jgi:hypothetical protein
MAAMARLIIFTSVKHSTSLMLKTKVRYLVPGAEVVKLTFVHPGLSVREVIGLVAAASRRDVDQVSLDNRILDPNSRFDDSFQGPPPVFVFSKFGVNSPFPQASSLPPQPTSNPPPSSPPPPRPLAPHQEGSRIAAIAAIYSGAAPPQNDPPAPKPGTTEAPEPPPAAPSPPGPDDIQAPPPPTAEGPAATPAPKPKGPSSRAKPSDRPPPVKVPDAQLQELPSHGFEVPCVFAKKVNRPKRPLEGIIALLTKECRRNVHEANLVDVTGSSQFQSDPQWVPKNAADLMTDALFYSEAKKNQWICYDFGLMRVCITHYSIRSASGTAPREWVTEGSTDGKTWFEMDRRRDDDPLSVRTFQVSRGDPLRLFRFRQTGTNESGYHALALSSLEVFGTLFRPDEPPGNNE